MSTVNIVSDWTAVRSTEASALAAQDQVMPGPQDMWGAAPVAAVHEGRVPEVVVDGKVEQLLRLAEPVGALPGALARELAAARIVLVRNTGELP